MGRPGGPGGQVGTRTDPSLWGTAVRSQTPDARRMGQLSWAEEGPGEA